MNTRLYSASPCGVQAFLVDVEVDVALSNPQFRIVGLPDQAVKESKDRVLPAIKNSGLSSPLKKVTVNLAPADLKKEGPLFDLPIALSILSAEGHLNPKGLGQYLAVGELALDGSLRPVKGIIQAARLALQHEKIFLFPFRNLKEVSLIHHSKSKDLLIPLKSLKEVVQFTQGAFFPQRVEPLPMTAQENHKLDMKDVKGQSQAKRAIEVALCGGHNLLMIGPPGGGKTMLARRIPSILPPLTSQEALEVAMMANISELPFFFSEPPFRAPHHSLSSASLVGGGATPRPGEVSLAHRGVLFLDELSEFRKDALEALRIPLEDKKILITRVQNTVEYPAAFLLVAATNPCKCGYLTSRMRTCRCTLAHIEQFRTKLSGPLLDRIDIQLDVPEVSWEKLRKDPEEERSATIRDRIEGVREIQAKRYLDYSFSTNTALSEESLSTFCQLDSKGERLLEQAMKEFGFSARAHTRLLKIARTIADMAASTQIQEDHIEEAISYRVLDRQFIQV